MAWSLQEFCHTTEKWLDNKNEGTDSHGRQFLVRIGSSGEVNLTEQGDLISEYPFLGHCH